MPVQVHVAEKQKKRLFTRFRGARDIGLGSTVVCLGSFADTSRLAITISDRPHTVIVDASSGKDARSLTIAIASV